MDEIQQTTHLSVNLAILAIVLAFAVFALGIRNDAAASRNEVIATQIQMREYREFNKYNNTTINGDEVVELLSQYAKSDIEIYVTSTNGTSGPLRYTHDTVAANPAIATLDWLRKTFKSGQAFKAQVVYDQNKPEEIIGGPMNTVATSEVTGISLQWLHN